MQLSAVGQHSLHSEGLRAVLVRSTLIHIIKMKFAIFFVLCFVAFAAAAPQLLTWPGLVAPFAPLAPRTVVAGPTVVNGLGWGGRFIAPGVVGATVI